MEELFEQMSHFDTSEREKMTRPSIEHTLKESISDKSHTIFVGPPGTGKTREISLGLHKLAQDNQIGALKVLQFHQEFTYQDFVEGYKPSPSGFTYSPGLLLEFIEEANAEEKTSVLFIDEINRGNISAIFGELLTLLEDFGSREICLPLSRKTVSISKPIVVIGAMNSADKNIAIMDLAIRRRFCFKFIPPNLQSLSEWLHSHGFNFDEFSLDEYVKFASVINKRIASDVNLGINLTLGQSIFVPKTPSGEQISLQRLRQNFEDKIIPQLLNTLGLTNSSQLTYLLNPSISRLLQTGTQLCDHDLVDIVRSVQTESDDND